MSGGNPTATVIVPTLNHAETVAACLDGLASQTLASDKMEVLVVDAGSSDATVAAVVAWLARHEGINARLLQEKLGSLALARNAGAQAARTDVLLFLDADCVPAPDWVATMCASLADPAIIGVRGAIRTAQRGLMPAFVQAEYDDRYDRMRGFATIDFIDNYAAAYRRDVFLANGGFDPFFVACEDQELSFRLAEKGYQMAFQPAAVVTHRHEAGLGGYMRRKFLQGYWKAPLTRLHPERMVQDAHTPQVLKFQIVLLSLTFGLAVASLLGFFWSWAGWLLLGAGAALAILLLSAAPFIVKLARRSPLLALIGPGMVLARSLALGAGYLAGTIHFAGALPDQRQPVIPGWKRVIKRAIDIVGALVGLLIAIPLVAIAAVAIKLDSPGPVFYWQVRIGENGRPFRIAKLRSMVANAEEQLEQLVDFDELSAEPAFKLANDPRVTRVGRILRRTSLDEAPQFYNVLRGDMSLVGPRPEEARVVSLYSDHQRRRLAVKPGVTGPMQVSGRGALSFSERLALELEYIEHFSLWRDFVILLQTLPVVMLGKGGALMLRRLAWCFWLLLGLVFYTYIGYGVVVALLVRLRPRRRELPAPAEADLPALTMVVAAHNEESWIVAKLENCLQLDYPRDRLSLIFVTDGSTDSTVDLLTAYPVPEGVGFRVLHAPERRGKMAAMNRAMTQVQTPLVVFSDANTRLNNGALRELARHFGDPQVGAVAGEKRVHYGNSAGVEGVGEGIYWRYESRLKQLDADLYTVVGAAGELFALRTALYEEMPGDIILDDFYLSLRIAGRGYRVAYAAGAYSVEGHSESVGEEFKRRARNASGGIQGILRMPGLLNPFAHGWLTFQYFSHRVLRWTITPLVLPLLFLLNGWLARQGGGVYSLLLAGQIGFYAMALLGRVTEQVGYRVKLFYIPYYFCVMNGAVYAGMWRLLRRRQSAVWERTRRADTAR